MIDLDGTTHHVYFFMVFRSCQMDKSIFCQLRVESFCWNSLDCRIDISLLVLSNCKSMQGAYDYGISVVSLPLFLNTSLQNVAKTLRIIRVILGIQKNTTTAGCNTENMQNAKYNWQLALLLKILENPYILLPSANPPLQQHICI